MFEEKAELNSENSEKEDFITKNLNDKTKNYN